MKTNKIITMALCLLFASSVVLSADPTQKKRKTSSNKTEKTEKTEKSKKKDSEKSKVSPQEKPQPKMPSEEYEKMIREQYNPVLLTHYVQPIKYTDEEVTVGIYITDWFQSEYRKNDKSHTFDVTVIWGNELDPEAHKIEKKDVPAGDITFNLGKLEEADYQISFECVDKQGRHSPTIYHEFIVRDRDKFAITAEQTWKVTEEDLTRFDINSKGEYGKFIFIEPGKDLQENQERIAEYSKTIKPESKKYVVVATGENYHPLKYDDPRDEARGAHNVSQPEWIPTYWSWKSCKVLYANDYDKKAVEKEARLNGDHINLLMDTAYRKGYRKLIFPKGYYRVSHDTTLEIPTGMVIDFNGSTIKLNQFAGCHGQIIEMRHCYNSHVVNAIVEGDYFEHDYEHSESNSEWVCGIGMSGDCRYSSYERILVRYITGYGVTNGMSMNEFGKQDVVRDLERGLIDTKTGELDPKYEWALTSAMMDIREFYFDGGYTTIGKYLGYQGLIGDEWNVRYSFYDYDKKYIKSIEGLQFRRVRIPDGASYMRVSMRSKKSPENLENLVAYLFKMPWNCWIKDIFVLQARCVGITPAAMYNHRIENCTIMRSGENLANCAFDAEDGADMMQDLYMVRNRFSHNRLNELLTCAGYNFMIEDNEGHLHFYDRTKCFTVRNNKFTSATFMAKGRARSLCSRVENNTYSKGVIVGADIHTTKKDENARDIALAPEGSKDKDKQANAPAADPFANTLKIPEWYLVVKDAANAASVTCKEAGVLVGQKLTGGNYNRLNTIDCEISNAEVGFANSIFLKSKLTKLTGHTNGPALFDGCTVSELESTIQKQDEIVYRDCEISNVTYKYGYWMKPGRLTFINCKIKNTDKPLVDTPAYSIGKIQFINCTFEMGNAPVVKIYDLRPQPTDGEKGAVAFLHCQVNTGSTPSVHIDSNSRDSKKMIVVYSDQKSSHSAPVLDKDAPRLWTINKSPFTDSMELLRKEKENAESRNAQK